MWIKSLIYFVFSEPRELGNSARSLSLHRSVNPYFQAFSSNTQISSIKYALKIVTYPPLVRAVDAPIPVDPGKSEVGVVNRLRSLVFWLA
jgi:hypothetical protein